MPFTARTHGAKVCASIQTEKFTTVRLWQRLFLAFAALSGLALLGFVAWQQQNFRHGFLSYLDEVALQRLEPARTRLTSAYAEHASWDFLRNDPLALGELIEPGGPGALRRLGEDAAHPPGRSPSATGRSPSATGGRSPSAPEAMDGREGPPEATDGREGPSEAMDGRERPP